MTTGSNGVIDPAPSISQPLDKPDRRSDPLAAEPVEPDVYTAYWQARSGFFNQTAKPPLDRIDPVRYANP